MLGMKTGFPLYVVGSSTFGTKGGYIMPGLFMGVLQVGWFAVGTFFSTKFILSGFGSDAQPGSLPFILVGIVWGYSIAYVGVKGIGYVSRVAIFLNAIPFFMILIVFFKTQPGIAQHVPSDPNPFVAFTLLIQIVIGFFATAGAAGADFGMSRVVRKMSAWEVSWESLWRSCSLPACPCFRLRRESPVPPNAGAELRRSHLRHWRYSRDGHVLSVHHRIDPRVLHLRLHHRQQLRHHDPRRASHDFDHDGGDHFNCSGGDRSRSESDLVLHHHRGLVRPDLRRDGGGLPARGQALGGAAEGINLAGYIAWALGFAVGILPFFPVSEQVKTLAQPAVVYSFITGFVVYAILAKAGLEPRSVATPNAPISPE